MDAGPRQGLLVENPRVVRRRVDVLAEDQAALEGEDVDAVPLHAPPCAARRRRRPLPDDEPVPRLHRLFAVGGAAKTAADVVELGDVDLGKVLHRSETCVVRRGRQKSLDRPVLVWQDLAALPDDARVHRLTEFLRSLAQAEPGDPKWQPLEQSCVQSAKRLAEGMRPAALHDCLH